MEMIEKTLREDIFNQMGPFDYDSIIESKNYNNRKAFSVFDHWLNEEEAAEKILFYEQVEEEPCSVLYERYIQYENKLKLFYLELYKSTQVYAALTAGNGTWRIFKFSSIDEYMSLVTLSIREQLFLELVIPRWLMILEGGHDLTHLLYIHKDSTSENELRDICQKSGVYILEPVK